MENEKVKQLSSKARFDRTPLPIYPAKAGNRTIPLLKTLLTSKCQNDCKFCLNRSSRICSRYSMEPEALASLTLNLHERGTIEGLFLSSALSNDPEATSKRELEVVKILREKGFKDYVHLRLMPGCSFDTLKQAAKVADRVGINIEAPKSEIYSELKVSEVFDYETGILKRMRWLSRIQADLDSKKSFGNLRAGIDTQFIVGATKDKDKDYLKLTDRLYSKFNLQRVYFSAFEPVSRTPLEDRPPCSKGREIRLYKASFLLRDYHFSYEDLVYDGEGDLVEKDPKKAFAETHGNLFPVEINSAPYEKLLLVPGIGPNTAHRIIAQRPVTSVRKLEKCGSRIKESLEFIDFPHTTLPSFL